MNMILMKRLGRLVFMPAFFMSASFAAISQGLNEELAEANRLLTEKKYDAAYHLFKVSSDSNGLAQFNLGLIEHYGWGRDKNLESACEWFELAAENKIPAAQEFAGDCYSAGHHRAASFSKATKWYALASASGLAQANCKLGRLYLDGKLTSINASEGIRLCELAGHKGVLNAQLFLAKQFYEGSAIIAQDYPRALYWYQAAAQGRDPEAQYYAAVLLSSGKAGVEDEEIAMSLAESAATQGFKPAYLLTAQLYMAAPFDSQTQMPTAAHLAKSYLWAQAANQVAIDQKQKQLSDQMLVDIRAVMPKAWEAKLDNSVQAHFQAIKSDKPAS